MNPLIQKVTVFAAACIVTAVAWNAWSSSSKKPAMTSPPPQQEARKRDTWPAGKTTTLIFALNQADSDEAKLRAANDLLAIPAEETDEAFNGIAWKNGRRLSLAGKILLIRMASEDGKATMDNAWKRLQPKGLWPEAFAQIGPAWAAHDAAGLAAWATRFAGKSGSEVEENDKDQPKGPTLDSGGLGDVIGWLVTENPEAAYQLLRKRGGFSSVDQSLAMALASSTKVKEALLAFGDMRLTDPTRLQGDEVHLYFLLSRWQDLDPDGFRASPHALSMPATSSTPMSPGNMKWLEVPAEQRAAEATRMVNDAVPVNRASSIHDISRQWLKSDPDACGRWLDSLPPEDLDSVSKMRATYLAPHDLNGVLDRFDELSSEALNRAWVATFDAWTKKHPGEKADRSGWPEERVTAWEDLEALQTGDR